MDVGLAAPFFHRLRAATPCRLRWASHTEPERSVPSPRGAGVEARTSAQDLVRPERSIVASPTRSSDQGRGTLTPRSSQPSAAWLRHAGESVQRGTSQDPSTERSVASPRGASVRRGTLTQVKSASAAWLRPRGASKRWGRGTLPGSRTERLASPRGAASGARDPHRDPDASESRARRGRRARACTRRSRSRGSRTGGRSRLPRGRGR